MKDQNYITIRIPKRSIRFSDSLKDKCFHDQPDRLSDDFEDDLVKQLEEHFSNMEITII